MSDNVELGATCTENNAKKDLEPLGVVNWEYTKLQHYLSDNGGKDGDVFGVQRGMMNRIILALRDTMLQKHCGMCVRLRVKASTFVKGSFQLLIRSGT